LLGSADAVSQARIRPHLYQDRRSTYPATHHRVVPSLARECSASYRSPPWSHASTIWSAAISLSTTGRPLQATDTPGRHPHNSDRDWVEEHHTLIFWTDTAGCEHTSIPRAEMKVTCKQAVLDRENFIFLGGDRSLSSLDLPSPMPMRFPPPCPCIPDDWPGRCSGERRRADRDDSASFESGVMDID
jgi:hypothetical protein